MKVNLQKFLLVFFLLTLNNCSSLNAQDPQVRYILQLLDGDNKDMYGCGLLVNISQWKVDDRSNGWDRITSWRWNDGVTQSERFEGFPDYSRSTKILKDPKTALIYVGKWHHVKKIGKDIRVIGYQKIRKGKNYYHEPKHQFESRNKKNEKIKEMKFSPRPGYPGYTHISHGECAIKWYDKYGYNAAAETKRVWARGFWGKLFLQHELDITGKIIQAKE